MTTIHILSDLHLEFKDYSSSVEADIVILAGDIHVGTGGLLWAREQFPESEILYVAGNHEFYRYTYQTLLKQFRIEAEKYNIHFLENDEIILDGIRFLGCTLWRLC
jgi:predicted phosphodiesterase